MCIAIYKPASAIIADNVLENCFYNNPDGMGMMYAQNGTIKIVKVLNDFDGFLAQFRKAEKCNPNANFVLHFRIATSGSIDKENCHPFRVDKNLAFCHNGIIEIVSTKEVNDTRMFNRQILCKLPQDFLQNSAICHLIEDFVGDSKLVFLDGTGKVTILNERLGLWKDGIWFSNRTFEVSYLSDLKGEFPSCEMCGTYVFADEIDGKICEDCQKQYAGINWSESFGAYSRHSPFERTAT